MTSRNLMLLAGVAALVIGAAWLLVPAPDTTPQPSARSRAHSPSTYNAPRTDRRARAKPQLSPRTAVQPSVARAVQKRAMEQGEAPLDRTQEAIRNFEAERAVGGAQIFGDHTRLMVDMSLQNLRTMYREHPDALEHAESQAEQLRETVDDLVTQVQDGEATMDDAQAAMVDAHTRFQDALREAAPSDAYRQSLDRLLTPPKAPSAEENAP